VALVAHRNERERRPRTPWRSGRDASSKPTRSEIRRVRARRVAGVRRHVSMR
jgi:hypothetical protein